MKTSREKAHLYLEEVIAHQFDSGWNGVDKLTALLDQYAEEREEKQREACVKAAIKTGFISSDGELANVIRNARIEE